ncbi:sugar ABC transporter permease [Frateuria sp. Soil773]|uniref:glycosyltransferase n=1 Tax=Frateuria sp. Soil773 TaxID=1736407 RepID=UPI0006F51AF7|nr:glycosyltransferase [Frateuria sp. Soil773]KRF02133.1 sugar ABC transporter permease [Frateuria sp. Soil773]
MKILVLTNLFPTPWDPLRGAFNRQQFERLGLRHEVDVLAAVDFRERLGGVRGEVRLDHLRADHFVFVYPPGIGRSLHAACWLLSLLWKHGRRLRAARYDCLLASWAYPDAVAAGWLARWLGIPYVVKVHGNDLNVQAGHALRRPQIRASLRGAGAVVAVSRALADKAVALGTPAARVHVVYNGVDNALFAPGRRSAARARLGLAEASPLLLYVGNLKPGKGCLDLLEAFPAVLAVRPRARLVYVGAGPARGALLERAAALGCADRVQLAGAVPHAALGDWFGAADLVSLPSHNEGVPNVLLEAMSCGTPVVASRVGGIPEVVPDYAGILVPPHATGALSVALLEATGRAWDSARIAAHAGGFRWDDNIGRLERILADVAAAAAEPSRATA